MIGLCYSVVTRILRDEVSCLLPCTFGYRVHIRRLFRDMDMEVGKSDILFFYLVFDNTIPFHIILYHPFSPSSHPKLCKYPITPSWSVRYTRCAKHATIPSLPNLQNKRMRLLGGEDVRGVLIVVCAVLGSCTGTEVWLGYGDGGVCCYRQVIHHMMSPRAFFEKRGCVERWKKSESLSMSMKVEP